LFSQGGHSALPIFLSSYSIIAVAHSPKTTGAFERGIFFFNQGDFFEAHEALEDVWRDASGNDKKFLQGLIQLAVAFHHFGQGNSIGARSLLTRASRNLATCPERFHGIEIAPLRQLVAEWQRALDGGTTQPSFPQLSVLPAPPRTF
jgi:predicted metal-dependent hydrolase